jgi:hypothetical protein
MKKRKLEKMPVIKPEEGEIERHNAYTRLNPKGHKEFVTSDEETLNELYLDDLLGINLNEYMDMGESTPAISFEQPMSTRNSNLRFTPRLTGSPNEAIRSNGDSLTNMRGPTKLAADSPEDQRAKSNLKANAFRGSKYKGNISGNKNIVSYGGDNIDYGATHNECVTSTAGIAINPSFATYDQLREIGREIGKKTGKKKSRRKLSENIMNDIDRLLNEWQPEFKAGEYDPGDYKMPSPTGNGVAKKGLKKDNTGARDTEIKHSGKPWPRKHNETAAMCDVEESGVETKPQGSHVSKHAKADDGIQTELGHNWPNPPKHSGGGVGEPVSGTRYTDGGVLKGTAPSDGSNQGAKAKLPSSGPITGTKGPQLGQMEWSPEKVGQLLGEGLNIQDLFDDFVRHGNLAQVDLESFQQLCDAHGAGVTLDENSLLTLMDNNAEFLFEGMEDSYGAYWRYEPLSEAKKKCRTCNCSPCECEGGCMEESVVSEMQIEPEEDYIARTGGLDDDDMESERAAQQLNQEDEDEFGSRMMDQGYLDDDSEYDEDDHDHQFGGGRFGGEDVELQCPTCMYMGMEEECPQCGSEMMSSEGDIPDDSGEWDEDYLDQGDGSEPQGVGNEYDYKNGIGPYHEFSAAGEMSDDEYEKRTGRVRGMEESIQRFNRYAKNILENRSLSRQAVTVALNRCWKTNASRINPKSLNEGVVKTLQRIQQTFPGFRPIIVTESSAMDAATGKPISSSTLKQSPDLADQPSPDDIQTHGDKSLLGKAQKNNLDGTPIMKGTEKGLSGTGSVSESVQRNLNTMRNNVSKLSQAIKFAIAESAKNVKGATVTLQILVREGQHVNATPKRATLTESVTDLEEILQLHSESDVSVTAQFKDRSGAIIFKADMPLATIAPRGPLVSEGKALFRFRKNAELFAENCTKTGAVAKLVGHNWGHAVQAKVSFESASKAFSTISEKKWLKGAVNPEHKGYCTPMTKSTCTPKRKALAKRFKKGGDLYSGNE